MSTKQHPGAGGARRGAGRRRRDTAKLCLQLPTDVTRGIQEARAHQDAASALVAWWRSRTN